MNPFEWLVDGAENGSPVRTSVLRVLRICLDWALSATVALVALGVGYGGATTLGVEPSTWVVAVLWMVLTWTLYAMLWGVGRSVLYRLGGRQDPSDRPGSPDGAPRTRG